MMIISLYSIHTQMDTYEYSESILNDMYGFISDMNDNLAYDSEQINASVQEEQNLEIGEGVNL